MSPSAAVSTGSTARGGVRDSPTRGPECIRYRPRRRHTHEALLHDETLIAGSDVTGLAVTLSQQSGDIYVWTKRRGADVARADR